MVALKESCPECYKFAFSRRGERWIAMAILSVKRGLVVNVDLKKSGWKSNNPQ